MLVDDYLKDGGKANNFMFVNYMEGHEGYPTNLVKDGYVEQDKWLYMSGLAPADDLGTIRAAYAKRLAYLDSKLKELVGILKKNGALDNAVLIIAGDHGQAFMEHGQMYHNMFPYEELSRVPLIVGRFRNGRQVGQRETVDKCVSLTALRDSILDIGYGKNDDIDGRLRKDNFVFSDHVGITEVWDAHLLRLLRNRSSCADAIYRTKLRHNRFATATYYKNFKLISYAGGKMELYDLEHDPKESENVICGNRGVALRMLNSERRMN
ncbi:Sulfatase [uncultured archaeon]|nr:Sulfatase [uncultured archaeon]